MNYTGEISLGAILGNLMIVVTLISIAVTIGRQIGHIQQVVKTQGDLIAMHSARLDLYESRLLSVIADVGRLIGKIEATQDRIEKQTGHRPGEGI